MVNPVLSFATVALASLSVLARAAPKPAPRPVTNYPVVDAWLADNCPGKYHVPCTEENIEIRKDFDSMAPEERKAFTDAIYCIAAQPSKLNQTLYPAATNRYMDYAVQHVNRTRQVHLSGFFLTWHRYFIHLFHQDLKNTCGYKGALPYWNWPATANNLTGSAVFDGSPYSMGSNGYYVDSGPVVLSPQFSIPKGSGGGCVHSGPFSGSWQRTMNDIPISYIIQGLPLPENAFALNKTCLTRDLNTFAATTWCNETALELALQAESWPSFDAQLNGVFGGGALGLHSGAHFTMGSPASSIYISVVDPIWWPLHTFLDNIYTSWQARHPALANITYGTETAVNVPPSPNVTLDTYEPDWGYFQYEPLKAGELISTTSGPFCYKYDVPL
jgi:tyrosinase